MNDVAGADAAATAGWPDLIDELDRWGKAGRIAALWWRDDDAAAATPSLDRLLSLAAAPLAVAAIPAAATPGLAAALRPLPRIAVLQHGWRHADHAAAGARKSEFPPGRPMPEVAADLAAGHARLAQLFGAGAVPVLVPPWNRFAAGFVPLLAPAGIAALSALAPRRQPPMPAGIAALDVHVDLVAWRGDRGFVGTAAALAGIVGGLRRQRLGGTGGAAPLGILTHHLVMDGAAAEFLAALQDAIGGHRAARWADIREFVR